MAVGHRVAKNKTDVYCPSQVGVAGQELEKTALRWQPTRARYCTMGHAQPIDEKWDAFIADSSADANAQDADRMHRDDTPPSVCVEIQQYDAPDACTRVLMLDTSLPLDCERFHVLEQADRGDGISEYATVQFVDLRAAVHCLYHGTNSPPEVWGAGGSSSDIKTDHDDVHSKHPGKRSRVEHDDTTAQRVTHKKTRTSATPSSSSR